MISAPQDRPLRIGTRGSPLALAQAREVASRLASAWPTSIAATSAEIVPISTQGDRVQDRELSEIGGKGVFTRELDAALLDGRIDLAVHSMKDVPTIAPDGLAIVAALPREDVRDALISAEFDSVDAAPSGAVIGTSSLRRAAQIKARRPDLTVVGFRGNVHTRLRKLSDGVASATFLAMAGLNRLGVELAEAHPIDVDAMLPAAAQGAVGVAARDDDADFRTLVAPLNCAETALRIDAERAFLRRLDGSCRTPIAALAEIEGGAMRMRGEILALDGSARFADERRGSSGDGAAMGVELAEALLAAAGPGFLAATHGSSTA